ncbi:disintegrin and metalloproteinase domain-containing protein 12-like [Chanos chanos]|uniref:Disintegrin and metalloproteinase domain-containing protein 12-like n=1 Tax=Chanos chanos TaxID=29144 RepID=A0A6J2VFP1_CHACN|nr:disintegrin and metalloproteinase domain-containing protein 12-like [Chanos chanos]
METVKPESWQRLPKPHGGAGQDSAAHLRRAPGWRRSGDWEGLHTQVNGYPRAARPQSCIEGGRTEGWIQHLERTQNHLVNQSMPAFSDRTVSMPALETAGHSSHNPGFPYLHSRNWTNWTPSQSPSVCESLQEGIELFTPQEQPGNREMARIRPGPRSEKAHLCSLAPVRIGWLPIQRRVIMSDGSDPGKSRPQENTCQTSCKKSHASVEGDFSPVSSLKKDWNQPLLPSAHSGIVPNSSSNKTSEHKGTTVPEQSLNPAPSSGDSPVAPKVKTSITSITISSRKVTRSASLPNTRPPSQLGNGDPDASTMPMSNPVDHPSSGSHVTARRKAVVVKVTEQRVTTNTKTQPAEATESFLTAAGYGSQTKETKWEPVILRRKPAIVKMTQHEERFKRGTDGTKRRPEFRHSYTEGLWSSANSLPYESAPLGTAQKPPEEELNFTFCQKRTPVNLAEQGVSQENKPKLHRSTLSLYFGSPSTKEGALDSSNTDEWDMPRRPVSCYAGVFRHTEPSFDDDPTLHYRSLELQQKTNIDPVSSAAHSSNRLFSSAASTGSFNGASPRVEGLRKGRVLTEVGLDLPKAPGSQAPTFFRFPVEDSSDAPRENDLDPVHQKAVDAVEEKPSSHYHSEFVLLESKRTSQKPHTLREALELRRPEFISRSRGEGSCRGTEGPAAACPAECSVSIAVCPGPAARAHHPAQSSQRSYNNLPEVRRKKEEEKRKLVSQTNRLRAELFKKFVTGETDPDTQDGKLEHHETTEPLLLIGGQQRPISFLQSMGHPTSLSVLVTAEGEQLLLVLEKNEGLFASHYTETHYLEDGSAVMTSPNVTVNCYYHGEVEGRAHTDVSLSACAGLRGLIILEDKTLVLEPTEDPSHNTHHIYRGEKLNLTQGTCGHGFNISHMGGDLSGHVGNLHRTFSSRHRRHAQTNTKYVELIIVADNREYQKQGKDVEKVKQRLAEIANYVDKFYRALNIRVALVGLEVWSDSDKCSISQDPFTTLHEFLDWRKLKLLPQRPHDNAQLVSGVYFQGTTIGMAPIMSMCTVEQSGGIVMDHSDNPLGAAVTLAHELGHNFGMNHDTPERGCGCRVTVDRGGCIMTPSTGYPFPTVFSSCSKKDLVASLEKGVGMCLFNMPEVKVLYGGQKCGNGYVEEGEECDCGDLEECVNPCCNATTCTLKEGAVCAHGQCCEDCQLKPAGTPCRDSSNSCDLPEFCTGSSPHCPANVYLHDGHACHNVDGHCYNGICQTHEQQCITLWGQGAKPAPSICFERVNSAGDPYGNCGKDSKGSFAKCEARDAKCGKIQCQGGANRPVIGTNAVSIETNIPLQEGGRILCRGTHVYLGDDMPDPGLVLAGTKCGDGMMCLNRQCQNVSVFGVHECSAKCSGRGVCNNNKNCHCEAHWAPPFCDKAGFGGSVDSGPMRLADNGSVLVGILVAFLCLICVGIIICLKRKTLIGLLFNNKKNSIEKLRSMEPNRPKSPKRPHPVCRGSPSRQTPAKPQSSSIYKPQPPHLAPESVLPSYSLRRLPQCPSGHLAMSLALSPPAPPPHRVPPAPHPHSPHRGASFRGLTCQNPARMVMELEKPSPPQKPLPADPLGKSARLMRSPTAVRLPVPIPMPGHPRPVPSVPLPARPLPKQPPTLPKPQMLSGVRYSS